MQVLLISANREDIIMRALPLGLASVAAATIKAGHRAKIVDLFAEDDPFIAIDKSIKGFEPEIVGISIRNIDDQNIKAPVFFLDQIKGILSYIRKLSQAPIVLGGAGYSIFPKSALDYLGADMGIQGEGEAIFPELLNRIQRNRNITDLPGLYLRGFGSQANCTYVKDLDRLPIPDAALLPVVADDQTVVFPVQSRRGCPMGCSYCSTASIEGRLLRKRSFKMVARDMLKWAEAGVSRFHFVDNIFNFPPAYAKGLCDELLKVRIPLKWRCIIYPGKIDEVLVRSMAKAGCTEVALGFESGCDRILRKMNKRFDLDDIRLTCNMFTDHGIRLMGFLLLGGPAETKDSVTESLLFADSLPLSLLKITAGIRIYPHTPIARIALSEGKISPHDTLLFPRFYLANGLQDWLQETLQQWCDKRSNWVG